MALSLGFAGCGFSAQLGADEVPPEAGSNDGGPDARPLDGCTTFSTVVDTCMVGAYGPGLTITGNRRYDTVSHTLADDPSGNNATTPMFFETTIGGNPITLVVVDGFAIDGSAKLRVTGARAFGVVSTAAIQIMGTLDGTNGGAGARSLQTCINAGSQGRDGADNNAGSGGASGGGGGAFGSPGGRGGKGDNNGANLMGGAGGSTIAYQATIIGGCVGGKGGSQGGGGAGGAGGLGGGAVFLTSAASIGVSGVINVGGGGGSKGNAVDGGAGGGGAGGAILLESSTVSVSGVIAANGGSGGGGAGNTSGTDGGTGLPSQTSAPVGQSTSTGGANGGAGGARAQPGGLQPADAAGGGGGGGGGAGRISIKCTAPSLTGTVSPNPATWPGS